MLRRTAEDRKCHLLVSTAMLVAVVVVAGVLPVHAAPPGHHGATLLYMLTAKNADYADKLTQCDRRTIAQYKKRGVRVIEKTSDDLTAWVEHDGKDYAKATPGFQQVAFARALGADAIGGLDAWNLTKEEVAGMPDAPKPGVYFHPWGMSLGGIYRSNVFTLDYGDKIQAIPLSLAPTADDPWAIATSVTATACSEGDAGAVVMSGRPFLGIGMEDARVTTVVKNSPAAGAGLKTDDELRSVDGQTVKSQGDLANALRDKKVGDTVEIGYGRDGKESTVKLTLADRAAVEALNSLVGKPLPDPVGKDIHGKEVRLRDLRGKIVVLDFWATWCPPCVEGSPIMQLLWEHAKKHHKDFVWLGVSVDEDTQAWKNFVKDNHLGGTQIISPEWAQSMQIGSFPTVLLVDRNGVVRCDLEDATIAPATMAMLDAK